jgi:hypothetical protein
MFAQHLAKVRDDMARNPHAAVDEDEPGSVAGYADFGQRMTLRWFLASWISCIIAYGTGLSMDKTRLIAHHVAVVLNPWPSPQFIDERQAAYGMDFVPTEKARELVHYLELVFFAGDENRQRRILSASDLAGFHLSRFGIAFNSKKLDLEMRNSAWRRFCNRHRAGTVWLQNQEYDETCHICGDKFHDILHPAIHMQWCNQYIGEQCIRGWMMSAGLSEHEEPSSCPFCRRYPDADMGYRLQLRVERPKDVMVRLFDL